MGKLFQTSGVRGVTNVEITPELALRIANLYGGWVRHERKIASPCVAVGHDQRHGARMLAEAAMAGLTSAGIRVYDFGQVSTGVLSVSLTQMHLDGAILVTGSHMPPERIGIIPLLADARYAPPSVTDPLEAALADFPRWKIAVRPSELHPVIHVSKKASADRYLAYLLARLDVELIRSRHFRVLLDCGNGTTGETARALFRELGCEVAGLNMQPDPKPRRDSECRPESCEEAIERTGSIGCHVGFAYDGDGDRVLVIDEQRHAMSMDVVAAILANQCLTNDATCVATINTSGLLAHVCRMKAAKLVYCPIGQPRLGEAVIRHLPAFACEPNSGKYAVCRFIPWFDAVFISALLLQIMVEKRRPISWFNELFPPRFQASAKLTVNPAQKEAVFRRACELLRERCHKYVITQVNDMDGLRLDLEDLSWVLIRMSGTEPVARVYSDGSQERANQLRDIGRICFEDAMAEQTASDTAMNA
ncbi:MAG: hypothetical protein Q7N87_02830 [Candidatus Uhrbacteria bacterium]|nr:hypothetical protein [Candidatus Uhrbacteria bacterium]